MPMTTNNLPTYITAQTAIAAGNSGENCTILQQRVSQILDEFWKERNAKTEHNPQYGLYGIYGRHT